MPPPTMVDLLAWCVQLMNQHANFFEVMGMNLFRAFAVIMICWFGVQLALSQGQDQHAAQKFASLLLTIAFGLTMIKFYSAPIPGFGRSFYHLIVDEGTALANVLHHGVIDEIMQRLNNLAWGAETPGWNILINTLEVVRYVIVLLAITVLEGAIYFVIGFGYIAAVIAVLLGPIFIPFLIVPGMEWMFWGWLRALLQYSFYPVIANAYLFVVGNLLVHFVDSHPPPYDGANLAAMFIPLMILLVAITYGVLKIPSLVNSLFTGKAGESAVPSL